MPSECPDRKPPKLHHHHHHGAGAQTPEQEHHPIPCPRCDSTNTKFCYYNNYNFSQPRHFCKSCRRYWTHGGTLRDIPVGGGTRKNTKRSRTSSSSSSPASTSVCGAAPPDHHPLLSSTPVFLPFSASHTAAVHGGGEVVKSSAGLCGSFTSLLSTQGAPNFLALGGFGLGLGPGLDDVAFGIGRGMIWPSFQGGVGVGVGVGGDAIGAGGLGVGSNGGPAGIGNTWQLESGDGGLIGGDCFPWPDLAISTSGTGLK